MDKTIMLIPPLTDTTNYPPINTREYEHKHVILFSRGGGGLYDIIIDWVGSVSERSATGMLGLRRRNFEFCQPQNWEIGPRSKALCARSW